MNRAGFACPVVFDRRGPQKGGESLFGVWQGWYVVHYGELVGYAAAAYIDT